MTVQRLYKRAADQGTKSLGVLAFVAMCFAAFFVMGLITSPGATGGPTTLQGVLIDKQCSPNAETRVVSGANTHLEGGMLWAYTHTRQCLLMSACQRSGYGIVPYEQEHFITFDAAGNRKALALIQTTKKQDDMRIEVTGVVDGDSMKVTGIKFLP